MFLLLLIFPISIFCTLIVTFGTPYDVNWCYQTSATTWDSCLTLCDEDDSCIMTYMSSGICYSCQIGQVYSVLVNDSQKFAFKSAGLENCSATILNKYENAPNYTVEFSKPFWNFTYSEDVTKKCDDGWVLSNRNDGIQWCVLMVEGDFQNQTVGEEICNANGSTLSGINNLFEQQYLLRHGWEISSNVGALITTLIDGYMPDDCYTRIHGKYFPTYYTVPNYCTLPETYIQYDNYSINPISYNWFMLNPDALTATERCLGVMSQKGYSDYDGKVDTKHCDTEIFNVTYCGKLAT